MRVWDINPGYLNRQSLLGEHRELHGIVSIICNNKKGYSKHPETLRWINCAWALRQRHRLLVAEMNLRGYVDRSPVLLRANKNVWPDVFVDSPMQQFFILAKKYATREQGRIDLPGNAQQLWAQHKHSVLARDVAVYKRLGQQLATKQELHVFADVALQLIQLLRLPPQPKLLRNAVLHMWGYVADFEPRTKADIETMATQKILTLVQRLATVHQVQYLLDSTALSELMAWK